MNKNFLLSQVHLLEYAFSMHFIFVIDYLREVIRDLNLLALYLDIPQSSFDAIELNYPKDIEKQKIELVKVWMDSSKQPPSWWHLVQALKRIKQSVLAEKISDDHSKFP